VFITALLLWVLSFDFYVMLLTVLAFGVARFSTPDGYAIYTFAPGSSLRCVLALPTFRLLSTLPSVRVMWFGLLFVLPSYWALVTVMLLVLYVYAVVGVFLYARQFELAVDYDAPEAVFDSMLQSLLTLYQMLTGAWSDIMLTSMGLSPWGGLVVVYFTSFVIIMLVLFKALVIGTQRRAIASQHNFACCDTSPSVCLFLSLSGSLSLSLSHSPHFCSSFSPQVWW
jgi:voltage-dependent calcium channel L type alpha-1D